MAPIYIMALITIAASTLLWGGLLYALSGQQRRYLWLLLPGLPLSAAVNLLIKRPVATLVGNWAHIPVGLGLAGTPVWFLVFLFLLAPVFEEAIKITPLLLPPVRRLLTDRAGALWTGLGLGISFGLGEAAYLAYGVAQSPAYLGLPWYAFTGYLSERLVVCFVHGVMTAVVVTGLYRGRVHILWGYLGGVALHALANAGAMLYQLGWLSLALTQMSLLVTLIVDVFVLEALRRRARQEASPATATEVVYFEREEDEQEAVSSEQGAVSSEQKEEQ